MKRIELLLVMFLFVKMAAAQNTVESKTNGLLEFVELDHGLAKVSGGKDDSLASKVSHRWLEDFVIVKVTDSILAEMNANFGEVYIVKAKDTVNIDVVIEWIYPKKITNNKGERFNKIKYTTKRPTNIPSASSYNIDTPFELVKGNWTMNIYLENKKVFTRTFFLY